MSCRSFVASKLFDDYLLTTHSVQLMISLTNITGSSPAEVCSLRDKKLNFQTTGLMIADHFESDCKSDEESTPFFNCTCCTGCW